MTKPPCFALLAVALAALILAGCAAIRRQETESKENLLAAAGFRLKPADTPERQQQLAALPPYKMVQRSKKGHVVYTYADPTDCKCLYVGNESNYQEYKRLGIEQKIARENLEASVAAENDAGLDWGPGGWSTWGPWDW